MITTELLVVGAGPYGLSPAAFAREPGIRYYAKSPDWAASIPAGRAAHTCDLVRFTEFTGARVLIIGGRQSAYEWAALLRANGVERIDVVHRHPVPRFDRADWTFVDT